MLEESGRKSGLTSLPKEKVGQNRVSGEGKEVKTIAQPKPPRERYSRRDLLNRVGDEISKNS